MKSSYFWPQNKKFAFTVFDDTDASTVQNVAPVYDFLYDLGLLTTKSVWTNLGEQAPMVVGGDTCMNPEYLEWLKSLQSRGFEIAWHNATFHSSTREDTAIGLEKLDRKSVV